MRAVAAAADLRRELEASLGRWLQRLQVHWLPPGIHRLHGIELFVPSLPGRSGNDRSLWIYTEIASSTRRFATTRFMTTPSTGRTVLLIIACDSNGSVVSGRVQDIPGYDQSRRHDRTW